MGQTLIQLENIEKRYGRLEVLGQVSLSVESGEAVGVVGENGAGKSTLLRIMAGVEKPDAGSVKRKTFAPGELGYVPQEPALYRGLTGRQNLVYWGTAIGLYGRRRRVRIKYLLELVNLTEKAGKRVSTYSGGMQKRLNLACALLGDVKLLLLDEPTAGADEASSALMLNAVDKLKSLGCGVVLVSHRREDIARLADRVVVLKDGKLINERPES